MSVRSPADLSTYRVSRSFPKTVGSSQKGRKPTFSICLTSLLLLRGGEMKPWLADGTFTLRLAFSHRS
jgi:hypothetical protein